MHLLAHVVGYRLSNEHQHQVGRQQAEEAMQNQLGPDAHVELFHVAPFLQEHVGHEEPAQVKETVHREGSLEKKK